MNWKVILSLNIGIPIMFLIAGFTIAYNLGTRQLYGVLAFVSCYGLLPLWIFVDEKKHPNVKR